jgi:hypothetical protein
LKTNGKNYIMKWHPFRVNILFPPNIQTLTTIDESWWKYRQILYSEFKRNTVSGCVTLKTIHYLLLQNVFTKCTELNHSSCLIFTTKRWVLYHYVSTERHQQFLKQWNWYKWDFKFSRRRVWCSELSSGLYCRVKWLSTDV